MLIVRDAFNGLTRFDDFQENLGTLRDTFRDRLAMLVNSGVLAKIPYSDQPPGYDYLLTDAGRELWPVLTAMPQWEDRHARPDGPIRMAHPACGAPASTMVVCESCGGQLGHGDVTVLPKTSLAQQWCPSPDAASSRVRAGAARPRSWAAAVVVAVRLATRRGGPGPWPWP